MSIIGYILWGLLAVYLAGAALFASLNHQYIDGGWFQILVSALLWPGVLVALWMNWRRGD